MNSIVPITVFAIGLLGHSAALTILEDQNEYIYYFDLERPPVIETYVWEEKHWLLRRVFYDSDGDWVLDSAMEFLDADATAEELERRRAYEKLAHGIQKDGVLLRPMWEGWEKKAKLYKRADLYTALGADDSLPLPLVGASSQLSVPKPGAAENGKRRESVAYRNLLKRLTDLKIAPPPAIPAKETR